MMLSPYVINSDLTQLDLLLTEESMSRVTGYECISLLLLSPDYETSRFLINSIHFRSRIQDPNPLLISLVQQNRLHELSLILKYFDIYSRVDSYLLTIACINSNNSKALRMILRCPDLVIAEGNYIKYILEKNDGIDRSQIISDIHDLCKDQVSSLDLRQLLSLSLGKHSRESQSIVNLLPPRSDVCDYLENPSMILDYPQLIIHILTETECTVCLDLIPEAFKRYKYPALTAILSLDDRSEAYILDNLEMITIEYNRLTLNQLTYPIIDILSSYMSDRCYSPVEHDISRKFYSDGYVTSNQLSSLLESVVNPRGPNSLFTRLTRISYPERYQQTKPIACGDIIMISRIFNTYSTPSVVEELRRHYKRNRLFISLTPEDIRDNHNKILQDPIGLYKSGEDLLFLLSLYESSIVGSEVILFDTLVIRDMLMNEPNSSLKTSALSILDHLILTA
uniref:Uncharacterized protein n=1 Tax=viral metagenome TaxID=1070528 RepID=A0A6C0BNB1_9ZZZZ